MSRLGPPLVVPPQNASGDWQRVGTVLLNAAKGGKIPPAVEDYAAMADALQECEMPPASIPRWRIIVRRSFQIFRARWPRRARKFSSTRCSRFTMRWSFTSSPDCWRFFPGSICRKRCAASAVWLIALAFFIHTTGLIYRMVLQGRPPVTNLYSSAIFIGWGAVILGLDSGKIS